MAALNLPTLRQLRHLVALAEHKHFSRAAQATFVTQSAFSASIKELETILGAPLVDRTHRGVVFTPLGGEVVERGRRLLADAEALAQLAQAAREPLGGPLRLGVIPTVSPFLLPRILPSLRRTHPKLKLYLTEDLTDRLVAGLHAGRLDVLLVAVPCDCGEADTVTLWRDRFALAVHADEPLARLKSLKPEQLQPERLLLLQDGHCLREQALSACRLSDPQVAEAYRGTSLATLVQMVDNGLGLTLVPQLALDAGILRGTRVVSRPLVANHAWRDIGLAWRRGTARRPEFELLAQTLKDLLERSHERAAARRQSATTRHLASR
jgi:LysR family hydrogen peroxide-inducible transcriptional activator